MNLTTGQSQNQTRQKS